MNKAGNVDYKVTDNDAKLAFRTNMPSLRCGLGRRRDLVGQVELRLPAEKKRGMLGSCTGTDIRCTASGTAGDRRTRRLGKGVLADKHVGVEWGNCIPDPGILGPSILGLRILARRRLQQTAEQRRLDRGQSQTDFCYRDHNRNYRDSVGEPGCQDLPLRSQCHGR